MLGLPVGLTIAFLVLVVALLLTLTTKTKDYLTTNTVVSVPSYPNPFVYPAKFKTGDTYLEGFEGERQN